MLDLMIFDMKRVFCAFSVLVAFIWNSVSAYEVKSVPTENLPIIALVTIAVPDSYDADTTTRYPTVYLLNGHGGDHTSWREHINIDSLATNYNVVIVCPAGLNSWYFDSPVKPLMKMESYITKDLVSWVDNNYRTYPCAAQRAITGLSMGGHGALWLAFRNADIFGNAGSTSGGVDFRRWTRSWNLPDFLGAYKTHKKNWDTHTVMSLIDSPSLRNVNIIMDCGEQDFFFKVNNALHAALKNRGIEHVYLTSPGIHNWAYWTKSILPQLEFFNKCFQK